MVPSLKLIILILAGSPALLAGQFIDGVVYLGLLYYLLLLFYVIIDFFMVPGGGPITVGRSFSTRFAQGSQEQIQLHITNNSRKTVDLWIVDGVPDSFVYEAKPIKVRLSRGEDTVVTYDVCPTRRGHYNFTNLYMRVLPALGIIARQFELDLYSEVVVYPNLAKYDKFNYLLRHGYTNDPGLTSMRRYGQGTDFESLRNYVPGDSNNKIDWKATARRQQLIVKNYEPERQQNVLVAIDAGRSSVSEFDGLSRLDYFIEAAIMLAGVTLSRGDWFSLMVFSDKVDRYLPPVRKISNLNMVVDQLYDISPKLVESDYNAACHHLALKSRKRSLVCLMTDIIDSSANADIIGYMARFRHRHLPLAITMVDTDVKQVAEEPVSKSDNLYNKAVAIDINNQRNEALLNMTRSGVSVLDVEPNQLTPQLLKKYLEIKQKSML